MQVGVENYNYSVLGKGFGVRTYGQVATLRCGLPGFDFLCLD